MSFASMDGCKEIIVPRCKEITDVERAWLGKELGAGNSYFFLGMREWQVVREGINADLGKSGDVS